MDLDNRIAKGMRAIQIAKQRGIDTSEWERRLAELMDAQQEAASNSEYGGHFQEWRVTSIPQWRRILENSSADGAKGREKYARWMLIEVLGDGDSINESK
jgi:hypothetical protein